MPARSRPGGNATGSQSSFSDDDVVTVDVRRGWRRPGPSTGGPSGRPSARPASRPPAPPGGARPERGQGGPPRRGRRARRIVGVAVLLVAVWAALIVWAGVSGWNHVHRVDAMPAAGNRPIAGSAPTTCSSAPTAGSG